MLRTAAELEACLGSAAAAIALKIIDHLDAHARRWISVSPLAFIVSQQTAGVTVTMAGADPGFAQTPDATRLLIARAALDDAEPLQVGCGVGMLFLVAGLGETLRVNGRVASASAESVAVDVDEVFMHCAKALLRSEFWRAAPREAPSDAALFLHQTRFLALGTVDSDGRADLSPKGDPAGRMVRLDADRVSYAERPGNRLADSLHNMLTQPRVAALALIPGVASVARISGSARLVNDEATRSAFAVEGKTPKLVTVLEGARVDLRPSPALARAQLWPLKTLDHGIDPAAVFVAHIKLNKTRGIGAKLLRATVSKMVMGAGLSFDYKKNMY